LAYVLRRGLVGRGHAEGAAERRQRHLVVLRRLRLQLLLLYLLLADLVLVVRRLGALVALIDGGEAGEVHQPRPP
jgi:hypothetical protein